MSSFVTISEAVGGISPLYPEISKAFSASCEEIPLALLLSFLKLFKKRDHQPALDESFLF